MKTCSEKEPENEPEKEQIRGAKAGPILLPSVAPEGTPQAMLLKKLAFGIEGLLRAVLSGLYKAFHPPSKRLTKALKCL